jgi:enoyl-CoA hydratase
VIRWEAKGAVGVATIDRPERRNALDAEMCEQLVGHLEANGGMRAIVVTGAGSAFCAGADLVTRFDDAEGDPTAHGGGDAFRPAFERMLDRIVRYQSPVIAAVNGAALGAGMQLAVACDLRVVSHSATLGIPASRLGIMLSASNVARLAQLVGQGAARDLLFTGRTLEFEEARAMGLVHRGANNALAAALTWASELAKLAPISIAAHKRALNLLADAGGFDHDARAELAPLEAAAFASRDLQEGLAAFAEKRPPVFEGR